MHTGVSAAPWFRRARAAIAMTLAITSIGAGCASGKLSRDEALRVLNASNDLRLFSTTDLPVSHLGALSCDTLRATSVTLAEFEREAVVRMRPVDDQCQWDLTDKGKAVVRDEAWGHAMAGDGIMEAQYPVVQWRVKRYTAVEISGISQEDDTAAVATVTFAFQSEFTERGLRMQKAGQQWNPLEMGNGVATLRRFDDGWRVETVELRASGE